MVEPETLEPQNLPMKRLDGDRKWAWKRPGTAKVRSSPIYEDYVLEKNEEKEPIPSTSMPPVDIEKCDPDRPQTANGIKERNGSPNSRPLQSSLKQPKNGNDSIKKGVSFSPDVPLETPNRPPLHEIMRQKDNHHFFRRCCLLVVVIILIVIGVLILASTIHTTKKDSPQQIMS